MAERGGGGSRRYPPWNFKIQGILCLSLHQVKPRRLSIAGGDHTQVLKVPFGGEQTSPQKESTKVQYVLEEFWFSAMRSNSEMMWGLPHVSPHVMSSALFFSIFQFTSPDSGLIAKRNTLALSPCALPCLSYPLKFWPFHPLPTATPDGYDTFCLQFCLQLMRCTPLCFFFSCFSYQTCQTCQGDWKLKLLED